MIDYPMYLDSFDNYLNPNSESKVNSSCLLSTKPVLYPTLQNITKFLTIIFAGHMFCGMP